MTDTLDLKKVSNIEFGGIDHTDHPDYSDAAVISADYDGKKMNDEQVDILNDRYPDFVYDKLWNYLH